MWKIRELYSVLWAGVEKDGRGFQNAHSYTSEEEALDFIAELQSQDNIYCIDLMKRTIWDKR